MISLVLTKKKFKIKLCETYVGNLWIPAINVIIHFRWADNTTNTNIHLKHKNVITRAWKKRKGKERGMHVYFPNSII